MNVNAVSGGLNFSCYAYSYRVMLLYFVAGVCLVVLVGAGVYAVRSGRPKPDRDEQEGDMAGYVFYIFVNPETNRVRFRVPVDYSLDFRAERAGGEGPEHIDPTNAVKETIDGGVWFLDVSKEARQRLQHPNRQNILTTLLPDGRFLEYKDGSVLFWSDSRYYKTPNGIDQTKLQKTVRKLIIFGELFSDEPDPEQIAELT